MNGSANLDERLIALAFTAKDAELTRSIMSRFGVACVCCANLSEVCRELELGAGALLITEEAVTERRDDCLGRWLEAQPTWSDLPILVLARPGADSTTVADAMDTFGNVVVLERPMRIAGLVSAVRAALRARLKQYETRDHLVQISRSERDLRDFFENASVGLYWVGPDGVILHANRTELEMLGYAREEYVGRRLAEFHVDRAVIEELLDRLARGETLREFPARVRRKDGAILDVRINANALFEDGCLVRTRCFSRDVTELKRAFEASSRLAAIVESSDDAMISLTLDGHIVTWNAGAERLFGYSAKDAIGRPVSFLIPTDRQSEQPALMARLRQGERIEHFETVRVARDGREINISLSVSPVRGADGRIVGAAKIARDITQRKRNDELLQRSEAEARRLLEERTQNERALRDADRRKDEFLAMLAHELRNPLAPIRNSLNILRLRSRDDANMERLSEMMERQVNHMVRLVDDLLEVSRITRGKIDLRLEEVELAGIVRSAVEASQPLIAAAQHQLLVSIPKEPLTIDADPVRLSQVIGNLLNNAAKYTEPGGQIWLSVRREALSVAISVRDSGIGIAPETLPHVFELFSQFDRQSGRSQGGLGIGLSIVKSLVELHKGQIEAKSEGLGHGSEFVIRLPVSAANADAETPRIESELCRGISPQRILVVDDNRDAAQSLAMLLQILGAEVSVAFSGPDALRSMEEFDPAVVLLDIGMPGMDGHEVAQRVRQRREFDHVTIIALTGWGKDEDRLRSRASGFDHHLVKPADINALESLLVSLQTPPT